MRVTRIRTFLKPQFVFSWFVRVDRALNHSGELVRTQFFGSVTGHFEPFTVWSSQLTGMESSVPSWVLTKVFYVMLYSVMHFCVLHSSWCLFDGWPFPCFFPLPWLLALTRYIFLDLTYPLPPANRPFHGFFNFWHGPVRENPCQHVHHWKERLNIRRIARFRYSSAPQRCENLQTLIWSTTETSGKFRDFDLNVYQAWEAVFHHEIKHRENSCKYDAQRSVFNELRGLSSGDETRCRMVDITSQTKWL